MAGAATKAAPVNKESQANPAVRSAFRLVSMAQEASARLERTNPNQQQMKFAMPMVRVRIVREVRTIGSEVSKVDHCAICRAAGRLLSQQWVRGVTRAALEPFAEKNKSDPQRGITESATLTRR